jgi:dinuclear metal center YbgI/SA1388 family protein
MSMVLVNDICEALEQIAPSALSEDFDNTGLLVGDPSRIVDHILVCHDALEAVIDEAIALNASIIVCFHPILFKGLKTITPEDYVSRSVLKAIEHKISIYALHTRFDKVIGGVSDLMAEALNLSEVQVLVPEEDQTGFGRIGKLPEALTATDFLALIAKTFKTPLVRHSELTEKSILRVAVLGGSGAFAIQNAKALGADAYISADFKYHDFFQGEANFLLADVGHYESERFTKNAIAQKLREKFPNFAVTLSEIKTNPVKYYTYG